MTSPRASRGYRPLHLAAENGHMEVLERLLAARATVDAEDELGRGAPELRTRPEGCGNCVDRSQRDSLPVTRVGRVDDRRKEQVSKIFEPKEREKN